MRHIGRNENEIAGTRFRGELQMFAQRIRALPFTT
jgi:hypothetical protein